MIVNVSMSVAEVLFAMASVVGMAAVSSSSRN